MSRIPVWRESHSLFESFRTILPVIIIVIICRKFDCISGLPIGILGEFCSRKLLARANLMTKSSWLQNYSKCRVEFWSQEKVFWCLKALEQFCIDWNYWRILQSSVFWDSKSLSACQRSTEFFNQSCHMKTDDYIILQNFEQNSGLKRKSFAVWKL